MDTEWTVKVGNNEFRKKVGRSPVESNATEQKLKDGPEVKRGPRDFSKNASPMGTVRIREPERLA